MTLSRPFFSGRTLALVNVLFGVGFVRTATAFSHAPNHNLFIGYYYSTTALRMSSTQTAVPSWAELQSQSELTPVGKAMASEVQLRLMGKGSAHVQNKLRQFHSDQIPVITLFRDHAAWCPYCQKTVRRNIWIDYRCAVWKFERETYLFEVHPNRCC